MKNKIIIILSYVAVAATAAALTLGLTFRPNHYSKLEELADLLEERFIDGADRTALENAAADAMVEALGDRWSYYIPASEYGAYQDQKNNSYVGIGVTISAVEEGYLIEEVAKGGPAEKAGLLAGDVMVAVDGTSVAGMPVDQGKELVQGKSGTTVEITVNREGQEQTFSVKRGTVKTPVATGVLLPDNIGLITIKNFNTNCANAEVARLHNVKERSSALFLRVEGRNRVVFNMAVRVRTG